MSAAQVQIGILASNSNEVKCLTHHIWHHTIETSFGICSRCSVFPGPETERIDSRSTWTSAGEFVKKLFTQFRRCKGLTRRLSCAGSLATASAGAAAAAAARRSAQPAAGEPEPAAGWTLQPASSSAVPPQSGQPAHTHDGP